METQSQTIESFVGKLIEEKGFSGLDNEVMNQIKIDLMERVEDRINAAILENMPKDKLEEFDSLLDSADSREIQMFCQNNIANLDEIIAQTLVDFRNIYLNS